MLTRNPDCPVYVVKSSSEGMLKYNSMHEAIRATARENLSSVCVAR